MPRVPKRLIDSVVFLYESEEAAYAGAKTGGTGYLTSIPFSTGGPGIWHAHLYLVTNSHVADHGGSVSVRINTKSGGIEVLTIPREKWTHHPDGDDIAVVSMEDLSSDTLQLSDVPTDIYMAEGHSENGIFGEGDECFVVGRNVGLEGLEFNTPACRFGAVAIMRPGKVWQPERQHAQESVVVEARSLGGFSGAPVFIYQAPPILAPETDDMKQWPVVVHSYMQSGFAFLGITWGHHNGRKPIEGPWLDWPTIERDLVVNSGMMLVVPAWKIEEILQLPHFVEERRAAEARLSEAANKSFESDPTHK